VSARPTDDYDGEDIEFLKGLIRHFQWMETDPVGRAYSRLTRRVPIIDRFRWEVECLWARLCKRTDVYYIGLELLYFEGRLATTLHYHWLHGRWVL